MALQFKVERASMRKYEVIETPCFPNKWKVENMCNPGSDNSTHLYFNDRNVAQQACDQLNKFSQPPDSEELSSEERRNPYMWIGKIVSSLTFRYVATCAFVGAAAKLAAWLFGADSFQMVIMIFVMMIYLRLMDLEEKAK